MTYNYYLLSLASLISLPFQEHYYQKEAFLMSAVLNNKTKHLTIPYYTFLACFPFLCSPSLHCLWSLLLYSSPIFPPTCSNSNCVPITPQKQPLSRSPASDLHVTKSLIHFWDQFSSWNSSFAFYHHILLVFFQPHKLLFYFLSWFLVLIPGIWFVLLCPRPMLFPICMSSLEGLIQSHDFK